MKQTVENGSQLFLENINFSLKVLQQVRSARKTHLDERGYFIANFWIDLNVFTKVQVLISKFKVKTINKKVFTQLFEGAEGVIFSDIDIHKLLVGLHFF